MGAPTESITGGSPEAPKPVPENGNPVNVDGPLVASDANTSATTPLAVPMMPMAEATPFERLQQAIAAAAKDGTPTEVTVAGDVAFTEGLLIDDNRNIIMRNAPGETARLHWAEGTSLNQSMITIMPGAALIAAGERNDALVFDGEGKASKVKGKAVFIENKGDLTIEKASFINAGNTSYNLVAPIRAIGADANITMNGGVIADNHFHSTTNSNSSWYTAGGILLDGGAHMVMNGGEIRGNKASTFNYPSFLNNLWANSHSAGAIMVSGGSQLEMNGGTISDNIGAVGGILVGSYDIYAYHRQATDVSSLKTLPISTFAFNDGVIIKNKGAGYSGGLFVFGAGHAVMNGGTISENQGYSGGGVLAMDWYVEVCKARIKPVYRYPLQNGHRVILQAL